jgi:hypothetical protein
MSVMRDYRPRKATPPTPDAGVVGWMILVSLGMALGFILGYGLLYTGV